MIAFIFGAQNRTRTCTTLRSLVPETSVSTNSTIWAFCGGKYIKKSTFSSFTKMDFYISKKINR